MNPWEISIFVLLAGVALIPFALVKSVRQGWLLAIVFTVIASSTEVGVALTPRHDDQLPHFLPRHVKSNGFVTSESCRSCHPDYYASWQKTYRRTMTQVATIDTVVAPFDNIELQNRSRTYQLRRRSHEFWITMADPDWESALRAEGHDLAAITNPLLVNRRIVKTFSTTSSDRLLIVSRRNSVP